MVRDKELNWRITNPHNTRHTRWNGGRGYLMRRKWIGDERFVIGWGDSPGEQGYHTGIHVHFRYSCVVNSPEFTTQLYVQCGIPPGEPVYTPEPIGVSSMLRSICRVVSLSRKLPTLNLSWE